MQTYEVYMPSEKGNMLVRVAAVSKARAREGCIYWFTRDPDPEAPHDKINGLVTVTDVTDTPLGDHPMWTVMPDYPPKKERSRWTRFKEWAGSFTFTTGSGNQ
jgi:hypothetical protein